MKYQCRLCDWNIEGSAKIISEILEHDKTHSENTVDGTYNRTDNIYPLGKKPKCKQCGCDIDHE